MQAITRWAALAVASMAMVLVLSACDDKGDDARPTATTTASVPPGETGSPTATATPTPEPTTAWRWDSGATDSWVWVVADERYVIASYGKEYQCCDNSFMGPGGIALLDAKDGREIWRVETPAHAFPAALLVDRVVFGTSDGTVYALGLDDGKELWRMDFPGVPFQAVAAGPVVVISDADPETWGTNGLVDKTRMAGRAWGLDPATGEVKWRVQAGEFNAFVAVDGGVVVVASHSTRDQDEVLALDAATGRQRWRVTTEPVSSLPTISGQLALVPGSSLRAFDLATGMEKWAVEPENGGTFVFPFALGDVVAVGTNTYLVELRTVGDGRLNAAAEVGDCAVQPFEAGGELYVLACGGIGRFVQQPGTQQTKLEAFLIPQGSVDSVAVSGDLVVFSTGIGGPNPEQVVAVRP